MTDEDYAKFERLAEILSPGDASKSSPDTNRTDPPHANGRLFKTPSV
ncbi:hypothetical protein SGL43_03254 [Streptomyces globisporus]|uniref:Uncharacterized protein n=1 Tax=Streptomyces globisporus TaxID=1908 RepID=A0ABM9GXD2_STRGL|nr:hypothetical protein [Streptomyces globisporus]CAH9416231.1 hypothetical protein SGL43_03254 [Streptomyces globisporus]